MKFIYYPGCTLHTKAKNLGELALASATKLGLDIQELENWTCCQAAFPLVSDNIMGLLSSARIIMNAGAESNRLTTLCSFCYNVLKRTDHVLKSDPEKLKKISDFLELKYNQEIEVVHFLEILKDEVGFDKLSEKVTTDMKELTVAPYYGCQILRPASVLKMDDPEKPTILDDFIKSVRCQVADFPFKVECCGSYQIINKEVKNAVLACSYNILESAIQNGADAITTTCPVCYFNLDKKQKDMVQRFGEFKHIPVFYFTELLGLALGVDKSLFDFADHEIDPRPLLLEKGILNKDDLKLKEEVP